MDIIGDSAEFEILVDLFRHLVVEMAKLPEPTPPITGRMPAGTALLALVNQGWDTLDKGLSPEEVVAKTTGALAMAAADFSVKLAYLAAKAMIGDERDPEPDEVIDLLSDAIRYMDEYSWQIEDGAE